MAEYSDGSIVIDTEINPEGLMKDSKKLNGAITSLVNQINRLGRDVTKALSKGTPAAIESLRQKFAQTGQDIAGMRQKLAAIADVKAVLITLGDKLAKHLGEGSKVHLEGIGYFQVNLQCKEEVRTTRSVRSDNVEFKSVSYRADNELKKHLKNLCLKRKRQI